MEPTKKTNSFLEVILLEPEADAIHTVMGITDERQKELGDFIYKDVLGSLKNKHETSITEDLHKISVNSKHANELVWMVFQYGANLGYNKGYNKSMNKLNSNPSSGDSVNEFLRFLLEIKRKKDSEQESNDNSDSE